ncbi:hypothetical protein PV327_009806 [Microctonus hyperodae]|uniref:BTB domain-containing protein n=1 Tax=Microctonus hyperodae TaxID=165561 RepID=A0AA39F1Q7_MICHY|nr:hypothetical protein PV327_009806 [Microctonus hyperodae]
MKHGVTKVKSVQFFYEWTIDNFIIFADRAAKKDKYQFVRSPYFTIEQLNDCKWYLYCKSYHSDENIMFTVILCRECDNTNKIFENRIKVVCTIMKNNGEIFTTKNVFCTFYKLNEVECSDSFNMPDFLYNIGINNFEDSFKIICNINLFISATNIVIPQVIESNLLSYNEAIYNSKNHTDFTFIIEDERIKVHRAILMARSPVFQAMFTYQTKEQTDNEIIIDDINSKIFNAMLQYIYIDRVINQDNLTLDMLYAADKYQLDKLKQMCEMSLAKIITIDNAIEILIAADLHNSKQLIITARQYVNNNIEYIKNTPDYIALAKQHPLLYESISKH